MANKKIAGITAKLGLDVTGLSSALAEIDKQSRALASEMRAVDKAMELNPDSVVIAAQKQEILAKQIDVTSQKLKELTSVQKKAENAFKNQDKWQEEYEPLKKSIDETTEKLKKLQSVSKKMDEEFASGKISADKYKAYNDELEATKKKMAELKKSEKELEDSFKDGHITAEEYRAFQREVETTKQKLADLEKTNSETGDSAKKLGADIKDSSGNIKNAAKDVKSYEDAVSDLNGAIGNVKNDLDGIAAAAGAAVAGIGTAAVGAVGQSLEVGMDFEKSMSKVQAISGATADDLARLEEAAKKMGATTSKTASESADALGYMALAGWNTEQMLTGLEPILRASEAGQMDLARTSDLVTDSMSAMGVEVSGLGHYLDVVAKAQSNSNTSMEQLLEAFVAVGGTAHNLGIDVEELSTIFGVMANRGIKGSEAGNALNAVLVNMLGSTSSTAEAMSALGLSMFDEEGNTKNMTAVLKDMGAALSVCTDEQKALLEAQLGGKTQMDALQAIINGVGSEYDSLSESLRNADGALAETARTMQENLAGQITEMQSALEGLGIDIYSYLEEPFKGAVANVTKEIQNLSQSVTGGQLSDTLSRLSEALGKLLESAGEFAVNEGIPALINTLDWISRNGDKIEAVILGMGTAWASWKIGTLVSHVVSLVKAIKDFKAAQEAATAAQIAANEAAMANVYVAVAAAVIALTAALGKLAASAIDNAAANLRERNALDETTTAIMEQNRQLDELKEGYKQQSKDADALANTQKRLWGEIQSLVDEEGRAVGSAEELQSAVSQLNAVSGLNIQIIDGQIQGYGELKNSIEQIIETQRKQAKLDYLSDGYKEAVSNIDALSASLEEAKRNHEDLGKKNLELQEQLAEAKRTGIVPDSYKGSYEQLMQEAEDTSNSFAEATVQLNEYQKQFDSYNNIIKNYESILTENTAGTASVAEAGAKAGGAYADGFADGAESGKDDVKKSVTDLINEAYTSARDSGKSVGAAAADALTAAMANGVEDSDIKKLIEGYISDIKYEQAKLGADDTYLWDEEEKLLSILPESSDLYKKYMTDILNGRKKLSDSNAKAAQKQAESEQKAAEQAAKAAETQREKEIKAAEEAADKEAKAAQKAAEDEIAAREKALEEIEKATDKYSTSISGVFTINEDKWGRKKAGIDKDALKNMEQTVKAKNELSNILPKLAGKGMPQSVIDELLAMDPVNAVEYAKMLLNSPDKFNTVKNLANKDREASRKLAITALGNKDEYKKAGEENGAAFATGLISAAAKTISDSLPDLSLIIKGLQTVNESNISQQTVKAESNAAQTETANNTTKTVSLLEALLTVMSGTFGENGMNIEVKPTIENTVTLDGKVIAKNTTEWQENEQIQHNK